MIDFHTLRSEVKQQLLAQAQRLDVADDPMNWAWLARAFASDGEANNPSLGQALDQARRWLSDVAVWQHDSNLGSIGLLYPLLRQTPDISWDRHAPELERQVAKLCEQVLGRYARLSHPDFAFGLAHLAQAHLSSDLQQHLGEHYKHHAQAENIRQAVLFAAAAEVVGVTARPLVFDVATLHAHEIIPLVWLAERYPALIDGEDRRSGVWEAYERLKEGIELDDRESGTGALHTVNPTDLAMLYEAVVSKTSQTDFVALFNTMPWHPTVRRAAGSLFLKGEYVAAVFEVAKLFIDEVKHKSGHPVDRRGDPLDGANLMSFVFAPKSPILRFNSLSNQTERNEQNGLKLIAEGTVGALRNPKGHLPSSAISLTAEEALEQLAMISYLMRRLDNAKP
jgi:uncharacterized protein (TIGR02391 family)